MGFLARLQRHRQTRHESERARVLHSIRSGHVHVVDILADTGIAAKRTYAILAELEQAEVITGDGRHYKRRSYSVT